MVKMFNSMYGTMSQCRTDLSLIRTPTAHPTEGEGKHKQGEREREGEEEREGDRNVNIEMCSIVTSDSYGE